MADKDWNPFLYPQVRHVRTEHPPAYTDYRKFREHVQREFKHRCVYCCLPDGIKGNFAVEHYAPKRFKHLVLAYSNLFYACANCNVRKGKYWPTEAQRGDGEYYINPCDHVMTDHLKYEGEQVVARTGSKVGAFMIDQLDLNIDEFVTHRRIVRRAIQEFLRLRREGQLQVSQFEATLATETDGERIAELTEGRRDAQGGVDEAEDALRMLLSTDTLAA